MRADVLSWVDDSDLAELEEHVDEQVYRDAASLLQVDAQLVEDSIEQLVL